jgi:hypothetical protein
MPKQILVTYFKFNPLGLEFGKPIKSNLLPHLGLIKNESQWFSGYPVRPPGFYSCHRHGYIPAERIHVHIPGHTGRIPGSYLRDKSWHSSLVAMTQLEDHMSQPCLTVSEYKIFELLKLIKRSLPMGVIKLLIVLSPSLLQYSWINIIGCTPSSPDGSSPRGYRQNFWV